MKTSYKVLYKKPALKFISKHKKIGLLFYKAFTEITEDIQLNFQKYDIKRLKGKENHYRLRIGMYRAIFEIQKKNVILYVIDIDSRGDIYK